MKLAYLSHSPLPSHHTNTEQMVRTLVELAQLGVAVDVYVRQEHNQPAPREHRIEEIARFYGAPLDLFHKDQLHIIEIPPAIPKFKVLQEIHHEWIAERRANQGQYDALYTRDSGSFLFAALAGNKPIFFETYRTDYNTQRRRSLWRRLCYRSSRFAGVIVHSKFAAESFLSIGVPASKLLIAYNGFSPELQENHLDLPAARARLGWTTEQKIVVYAGNIQQSKGLASVLDIASHLPEVIFAIVGAVPGSVEERELRSAVGSKNLENVWIVPRVPPPQTPLYLHAADCLIIPPTAKPLQDYGKTVLPMKTFIYLAAGRPILAPDLPDIREILVDGRNAMLVPPDSAIQAANALRQLLNNPQLAASLSAQAQADSQLYTWKARASRILDFLKTRI